MWGFMCECDEDMCNPLNLSIIKYPPRRARVSRRKRATPWPTLLRMEGLPLCRAS